METPATTEHRDYLEGIQSAALSLVDLSERLLAFADVNIRTIQIRDVQFRLSELLEAVCAPLLTAARRKGIRLSWHIAPGTPETVLGSQDHVRRILSICSFSEAAISLKEIASSPNSSLSPAIR